MLSFDLVDQPWLPVQRRGQQVSVSLREALTCAHEIDDLALSRPTHVPAVLRQVLLPALIDMFDVPHSEDDWAQRWSGGRLDSEVVADYLDEHRGRFDLFHPERPFAQVADLESVRGERKPSPLLIPSIAGGNNVPLFSATTEAEPPSLGPAQAVLGLLYTHCWDTAGIKTGAADDPRVKGGKTTGNPVGPLGQLGVLVPTGSNLFETLMLNTPILPDGLRLGDRPQWRAKPLGASWEERTAVGLLDLCTWQARRIRLFPSEGPDGPVVREVVVAAGDRLVADPDLEPHTAWTRNLKPKPGDPQRRPRRLRPGRSVWRGLDALLAIEPPEDGEVETSDLLRQAGDLQEVVGEDYPLSVLAVGVVYGTQWAVVEHVVADRIPLPVAALRKDSQLREVISQVVGQADDLARAANGLAADLRRSMGAEPIPWDRGQRPEVELIHELDPYVRRLLAGLQRQPGRREEAERAWEQVAQRAVMRLADRLVDALPPSAFAGRTDQARGHTYRPANAERYFRWRVRQALPAPDRTSADEADLEEASGG